MLKNIFYVQYYLDILKKHYLNLPPEMLLVIALKYLASEKE